MTSPGNHEGGAEASPSVTFTDTQEVIARIMEIPRDELSIINDYDLQTCEGRIAELTSFAKKPYKKACVANVPGKLALLWQRKAELHAGENKHRWRQKYEGEVLAHCDAQEEIERLKSLLREAQARIRETSRCASEEVNNVHNYERNAGDRIQELISVIKSSSREAFFSDVLSCKTQLQSHKFSHVEERHEKSWLLREHALSLREKAVSLYEQSLSLRQQSLDFRQQSLDSCNGSTRSSEKMEPRWVENKHGNREPRLESEIKVDQLSSVPIINNLQQCDERRDQSHTDPRPAGGQRKDPAVNLLILSEPRGTASSPNATDTVPDLITWDEMKVQPPRCKMRKGGSDLKRAPPFTLRPTAPRVQDEVLNPKCGQPHNLKAVNPKFREPFPDGQKLVSGGLNPHFDLPVPQQTRTNYSSRHGDRLYQERSGGPDDPDPPHRQGLRLRDFESLASDIEHFDPDDPGSNIENYLDEVQDCLRDLPHASSSEKVKLLWKTTARSVRVFIRSLPAKTRDCYEALLQALLEEYFSETDWASATLAASSIKHQESETPKDYYWRLRAAFFQGRNTPGLENDRHFKSLFLHNLHESVRCKVTLYCSGRRDLKMREIRGYAELAWETQRRPTVDSENGPQSDREVFHPGADARAPPKRRRRRRRSAGRGGAIYTLLARALNELHDSSAAD
ncbi:uncharacterized protein LOC133452322 [Cololabis saira]|uniref:uncharacterized protein LOC133452322 n=1 Tax=Cololabis saira TaxID=129043 RepID=UPI002AD57BB1|nr:uncharacterized protein LOC133452322 [Cololabis saira]